MEALSETQFRVLKKELAEIRDVLYSREIPPPSKAEPDEWLNLERFKEITGRKDTSARAYFKNPELIRRGILIKDTGPETNGGWLMNYPKWIKWCKRNAELALKI